MVRSTFCRVSGLVPQWQLLLLFYWSRFAYQESSHGRKILLELQRKSPTIGTMAMIPKRPHNRVREAFPVILNLGIVSSKSSHIERDYFSSAKIRGAPSPMMGIQSPVSNLVEVILSACRLTRDRTDTKTRPSKQGRVRKRKKLHVHLFSR